MAGVKGRSGRKPNERLFREILTAKLQAVHDETDGTPRDKASAMCDALIDEAVAGDLTAINMVMDRVDGKPKAQHEHTGADGGPIQTEQIKHDADAFRSRIVGLALRAATHEGTGKSQ